MAPTSAALPAQAAAKRPTVSASDLLRQLAGDVEELRSSVRWLASQVVRGRQKAYAVEATARLAAAGRTPRLPMRFVSQFGEDMLAYDLFDGRLDGFFVEAGAFDGVTFSATYALEAMGWRGLLVEGIPERAAACRVARPGSAVVHAALAAPGHPAEAEFTVVHDNLGGMLSYLHADASHLEAAGKVASTRVRVPLATLDSLLAAHQGPIDLLVLDVEGAEADVLRGLDLKARGPRLMLIEDNQRGDPRLDAAMAGQPYHHVGWLEVNRIYIHHAAKDLLSRTALV